MKKQKMISDFDRFEWTRLVNSYLEKGWVVVPGTVCISSTECAGKISNIFSIVIELTDESKVG